MKLWPLALAAAFTWPTLANAQSPLPKSVQLHVTPCKKLPFDRASLQDMLQVELIASGIDSLEVVGQAPPIWRERSGSKMAVIVGVRHCDRQSNDVTLLAIDARTNRSSGRSMVLSDVEPQLRGRAIAIAIVELLRTNTTQPVIAIPEARPIAPKVAAAPAEPNVTEGAAPSPPAAPPRPSEASPTNEPATAASPNPLRQPHIAAPQPERTLAPNADPRPFAPPWAAESATPPESDVGTTDVDERARQTTRGPFFGGGALIRYFPERDTRLIGASALAGYSFNYFRLVGGMEFGAGEVTVPAGRVEARLFTGFVGASLVAGTDLEVEVGPRLHMGYGLGRGRANDLVTTEPLTADGRVAHVGVAATLRLPIWRGWTAYAGAEGGHTLWGLSFYSDDTVAAGLSQVAIAGTLGVTWHPDDS